MDEYVNHVKKMIRLLERGVINEEEASSQTVDSLLFVHARAKEDAICILQDLPLSVLTNVCRQLAELSRSDDPHWQVVLGWAETLLERRQGKHDLRDAQQ